MLTTVKLAKTVMTLFKSALTLFLMRNPVPVRKQENYNPARKMRKKFGNSWEINLLEKSGN